MKLEPAIPDRVLTAVRAPFEAAGGARLETAVAEPLSLYLDLAGEALRERLFLVQGPGREEYCLRPDFTLGVALAHIARAATAGRYVYEGPAFRVAPPGSGRTEQFLQVGLEVFEAGDAPAADAAMAALAWRAAGAGGRDDLSLMLGDVALFGAFLAALGIPEGQAARLRATFSRPWRLARELAATAQDGASERQGSLAALLRGLGEAEAATVLEEVWALAGVEPVGGRSAGEIVHRLAARASAGQAARLTDEQRDMIGRYLAIADEPGAALAAVAKLAGERPPIGEAIDAWRRRLAAMSEIPSAMMRLATAFARGFGYYDGVLFEVRSAALGDDQPLAAGGRYDSLPARLGAPLATGAVGCMVRPGRAWRDGEP
jgi:ATP phosphoribosyltransferase regulatory subunit